MRLIGIRDCRLILLLVLWFAWNHSSLFAEKSSEKIGVVATVLPLADFAEEVGGEQIRVSAMVPPGADPHTYEPLPGQLKSLSRAQLYVAAGSGVEFELVWLDKLKATNPRLVICNSSVGIQLANTEDSLRGFREGRPKHNHSDPHVWLSPRNAVQMAKNIRDSLIRLDPKNEAYYQSRFESFASSLRQLDLEIKNTLVGISQRNFMVYHPAWGYFAKDYLLNEIAIEVDGKEPSAARIAGLIKEARARGIRTIFASPQFSQKSARVIAKEIGGKVILVDDLAKDYFSNLRKVANDLARELK